MNNTIKTVQKGQVWYARLIGEENMQSGLRPVVIFNNSMAGKYSPNCTVIPVTSKVKKVLPTHTTISKQCGLVTESVALAENIITISKSMLISYIGEVSELELEQIENSILCQLGIYRNINNQRAI